MKKNKPQTFLHINNGKWQNRLLIGTPLTGLVRAEWMFARYGNIIPTNWSQVDIVRYMNSSFALRHQIADAENLIVKNAVEGNFEWLLFIEHDNIIPPDAFIKINQYMLSEKVPVVGGLYFTKSDPPEPMIYRDIGWGYYNKWKLGDKVWAKGIPFGFTLIHGSILKEMWKESEEYETNGEKTRRVFNQPAERWQDPQSKNWFSHVGTSDLEWCKRVIEGEYFAKAGWTEYQKKKYPFLVDTSIFVHHIDMQGQQWPLAIPNEFLPVRSGVRVSGLDRFNLTDEQLGVGKGEQRKEWVLKNKIVSK